jgi:hypothetical protein
MMVDGAGSEDCGPFAISRIEAGRRGKGEAADATAAGDEDGGDRAPGGGVAHDFNNIPTVSRVLRTLMQKVGKESLMLGELEQIKRAGDRGLDDTAAPGVLPEADHRTEGDALDRQVAEVLAMLARLIGEDIALQTITANPWGQKIDPAVPADSYELR